MFIYNLFHAIVINPIIAYIGIVLVQAMVDGIVAGESIKTLMLKMLGFYIADVVLCVGQLFIASLYLDKETRRVKSDITMTLCKESMGVDYKYFDDPDFFNTYVWMGRNYANTVINANMILCGIVSSVFTIATVLGLIVNVSPWIIVISLVQTVIVTLIQRKTNILSFRRDQQNIQVDRRKGYYSGIFMDRASIDNIKCTKLSDFAFKNYEKAWEDEKSIIDEFAPKICGLFSTQQTVKSTGYFVTMFYICLCVFGGESIGLFTTVIESYHTMASNLSSLFKADGNLTDLVLQSDAIDGFYAIDNKIESVEKTSGFIGSENRPFEIEFRNVSFKYPNSDFSLKNINLVIKSGEKNAIVGMNGAGKSTLIKLIMRFYDVDDGELLINGKNIKEYDLSWLRNNIGCAFQTPIIYAMTMRENLNLYNEADDAKIGEIVSKTKLDDVLEKNGANMDSQMTKNFDSAGIIMSGGENQKLAISRVLTGNFGLKIFDEPTASLDPISEENMMRLINDSANGSSSLIISHRLSAVTDADQIIVMDNGEILEKGSHSELLEKKGKYYEMFTIQGKNYKVC
jgi:ATP-binding cassette, subfamily B, bacterial